MKKIKKEDFQLKSIKIQDKEGAIVEWKYLLSVGNEAHIIEPKITSSVNVQDELWDILKKQKPNVLQVEEINYRLMTTTAQKAGVNDTEMLSQIAEGMTQEAMSKIEITGMKLSGTDDNRGVIINYKKITGNKKIAGRSTTLINLSQNIYGFEEELEADIEDLVKESYGYVYEGKHSESAQGELWKQVEEEEVSEESEASEATE